MRDDLATQLRSSIVDIERELSALEPMGSTALKRAWSSLVALLDLGPEPRLRACPHCGGLNNFAATRCSTCWSKVPAETQGALMLR
jgi:hypothetical protein